MLEAKADTWGWAKERFLRVVLDPVYGIPASKSLYRVAKEANISYSWAHDTWRDLVQAGAFEAPEQGNPQVADIEKAFQYWLGHRAPRQFADFHVLNALDFLRSLETREDLEYMATTYLAENIVQGHLFPRRFDLYIRESQAGMWQKELRQRGFPIDSKDPGRGTVRLIVADSKVDDEGSATIPAPLPRPDPVRGIWIARMPLLIVDLFEGGGPCAEAALMLLDKTYA